MNASKAPEHPATRMEYTEALVYVEAWLTKHHLTDEQRAEGYSWKIYDYLNRNPRGLAERPWVGVRVSEVAVSNNTSGGCYMQVDAPWGIAICGQIERCVLALIENWNQDAEYVDKDGGYVDGAETDEEFWRLAHLVREAN